MKMKDLSVFYDYGKAGKQFEKTFSNNFYYRLQNNSSGLFYNLIHDEDRDKFTNTRNVSDSFVEVKTTVFVIITY